MGMRRPSVPFVKMHGLGNDFIVIDDLTPGVDRANIVNWAFARKICDRRFGVGADQILWIRRPQNTDLDARMEIVNADGSFAEMCGNGIRAVGLFLHDYGPRPQHTQYGIETLAGAKSVQIQGRSVTVDMGVPVLGTGFPRPGETLEVDGQSLQFFDVNMGNPHAVFFVDDVDQYPVERLGPLVERHPRFPKRTNVEFVQVLGPREIKVRVWERGTGITLACGTGACASSVASIASERTQADLMVELPGGRLHIAWGGPGESVLMEGPAEEVFRGEYYL